MSLKMSPQPPSLSGERIYMLWTKMIGKLFQVLPRLAPHTVFHLSSGGNRHHTLCGYLCGEFIHSLLPATPGVLSSLLYSKTTQGVSLLLPHEAGRGRVSRRSEKVRDWPSCKGTRTLARIFCCPSFSVVYNLAAKIGSEAPASTPPVNGLPRNRSQNSVPGKYPSL